MKDQKTWDNIAILKEDKIFLKQALENESKLRGKPVKMYEIIHEFIEIYKKGANPTPPAQQVEAEIKFVEVEKPLQENEIIYSFTSDRLTKLRSIMKDKTRPEYVNPPRECQVTYGLLINTALDRFIFKTEAIKIG